jgi:hypothetical protein
MKKKLPKVRLGVTLRLRGRRWYENWDGILIELGETVVLLK